MAQASGAFLETSADGSERRSPAAVLLSFWARAGVCSCDWKNWFWRAACSL